MPALFDLPIDQLPVYQGTNPRPADFDAYWDRALAEMRAVDPNVELVESRDLATRNAECFDLWFTGTGGARVHAKFLRPRNRAGRGPAVVEFHGYSQHSGDWTTKLALVAEGFCVASLDCRGQGGLSEDSVGLKGNTFRGHIIRGLEDPNPDKLMYRQLFLDTAQLAGIVMGMPEVDPARVASMGSSQGGGLALACAALEPRICRTSAVFPFLCDYQRVWKMDQAKDAYEELRLFFRWRDPRHEREEEFFTRLGYVDVQHLAPRIRSDVLMFTSFMDTVCPPSTQFAAYNKIRSPKRMVRYPDFGHETLPGQADITFNHLVAI